MKLKSFNGYLRNRAKVSVTINLNDPNLELLDYGGIMNSCLVQGFGFKCSNPLTCKCCSFNLENIFNSLKFHE